MKRVTMFCLIGGMSVWLGMTGDGCEVDPATVLDFRAAPAIISTSPVEATRMRTLEVDLRRFPETNRITWEFGDGSLLTFLPVNSGRTVTHEFARDGTFEVRVHLFSAGNILTNGSGRLITTGSLPIDIVGPNVTPIPSFVVEDVLDDTGALVPLTKRFVAANSRDPNGVIVEFRWDFGDGVQGLDRTIEHTFSRSGRFPVRLTVTDNDGLRASVTRLTLVNTLPVASFTFQEDPNNALRFTFNGTGSTDADGAIQTFTWDFGDGTPEASGGIVAHTYAEPDDYTVTLTITDEFGASISTSQVVDVTGTEPFVRTISLPFGEVDTTVTNAVIDGENFQDGATVRLERGSDTITATSVTVQNETTIQATFDLSGAVLGDYDLVVENPDTTSATLPDGFRVVTPNRVRLTTNFGDIVMELVDDAPVTTANFLQYVEDDFYDGTIFHRVVPDFVVQGGGFLPGMVRAEGVRDPIVNEFSPNRSNVRGTVAMAKLPNDPDSATSEFFFNLGDNSNNLDNQNGGFTVFANVVEGLDVVDQIAAVPIQGETPIDDVLLIRAERE